MQFRVVLPANVKPGERLRVTCPDGTQSDTVVPQNLKADDAFLIDIPVDQLKSPHQILNFMQHDTAAAGFKGFLFKNVSSILDVLLAVIIGCVLAYWTILGFLAGVLYGTREYIVSIKKA